jgi:hypothetical protein
MSPQNGYSTNDIIPPRSMFEQNGVPLILVNRKNKETKNIHSLLIINVEFTFHRNIKRKLQVTRKKSEIYKNVFFFFLKIRVILFASSCNTQKSLKNIYIFIYDRYLINEY